jgi:alkylation response protein AidB-like acyl-CoA dehydrogenase
MELEFNEREQAFLEEVEDFLAENLPPDWPERPQVWPGDYSPSGFGSEEGMEIALRYRAKLIEKGWNTIAWPREHGGREATWMEQAIFDERTSYHRAPNIDVVTTGIVAPMLLHVGSDEQRREWLPRIAAGEISMWLAYSEPNAGSDLGGLQTTAIRDGDEYVVNGQKVWSSGAHLMTHGWMIARTDPEARKHRGVSFFIVDNAAPGITMRQVENILGEHHFNEVFFDDVRVPADNLVGEENMGFYHLMTALDYERVVLVGIGGFRRQFEEIVEWVQHTERNGRPLRDEAVVRRKLAELAARIEIGYSLVWKTAQMLDDGLNPHVESSVLKLLSTELARDLAEVGMDILGPYGQLTGVAEDTPLRGLISRGFLDSISATIGAGTSEIQRNIIAQRGLELPRK